PVAARDRSLPASGRVADEHDPLVRAALGPTGFAGVELALAAAAMIDGGTVHGFEALYAHPGRPVAELAGARAILVRFALGRARMVDARRIFAAIAVGHATHAFAARAVANAIRTAGTVQRVDARLEGDAGVVRAVGVLAAVRVGKAAYALP